MSGLVKFIGHVNFLTVALFVLLLAFGHCTTQAAAGNLVIKRDQFSPSPRWIVRDERSGEHVATIRPDPWHDDELEVRSKLTSRLLGTLRRDPHEKGVWNWRWRD